jgi:hypothetical protein
MKPWMLAVGLFGVGVGALLGGEDEALGRWVDELTDTRFRVRRQAEDQLRRQSVLVVPLLDKQSTRNLEHRLRLDRLIAELRRLPWHHDLQSAQRDARATGKPLLVFSTLGDVYGFG